MLTAIAATAVLAGVVGLRSAGSASMQEVGVYGETFPIVETDILEEIATKLAAAERDGRLTEMQSEFQRRVEAKVERPPAVQFVTTTEKPKSWLFDPSIIVPQDYADQRGRVFAHQGDRINPIERTPGFDRVLIFIDGDDRRQVDWALSQLREKGGQRTRVILVKGAPMQLMRAHKAQFFFDQEGRLTSHFEISQVPAIIEREENLLRISEVKPW